MNTFIKRALPLALLLVFGVGGLYADDATTPVGIFPTTISGNTPSESATIIKFDPPTSGTYALGSGFVTFLITSTDQGEVMTWSVTGNIVVDRVWAKGGNFYNDYNYSGLGEPHPTTDGNLHCPEAGGSGKWANFSHVNFVFHEVHEICDITLPTINGVELDTEINCPPLPFSNPTVTDTEDPNPDLTFNDVTTPGSCPGSFVVTRTWTAVDRCGNRATASQTITVVDNTPPSLSDKPLDATFTCIGDVPEPPTITAYDECPAGSVNVTYAQTESNLGSSCNNVIKRTWTATDACGNSTSYTQTIIVNDDVKPTIAAIENIIVDINDGCAAIVNYEVKSTDNCDADPVVTVSPESGSSFGFGVTTVNITSTDDCGNVAEASFTVTVRAHILVTKFYDANVNGQQDVTEVGIADWQFTVTDANGGVTPGATGPNGTYDFAISAPGPYTVTEVFPTQANWLSTTHTSCEFLCAGKCEFGNVCLGAGGGRTLGFWSNKNGQAQMNDGGTLAPELALLFSLDLVNASGVAFNPTTYLEFRTWILNATAVNMAYMLSAQLSAMTLNVEAGLVGGGSIVYAPGCGNTGAGNNYMSIGDLVAAASAALNADGYTPSGDANRAVQECLKNALDKANNNLNFVQAAACPFTYPVVAATSSSAPSSGEVLAKKEVAEVKVALPNEFTLEANYPNPFNPSTTIRFAMPDPGTVRLVVYNVLGQKVATLVDGFVQSGFHQVVWNAVNESGQGLASGIYLYRIEVQLSGSDKPLVQTHKMLLMK